MSAFNKYLKTRGADATEQFFQCRFTKSKYKIFVTLSEIWVHPENRL